jgi:hypothetical protein
VRDQVSHPYSTTGKITVFRNMNMYYKDLETGSQAYYKELAITEVSLRQWEMWLKTSFGLAVCPILNRALPEYMSMSSRTQVRSAVSCILHLQSLLRVILVQVEQRRVLLYMKTRAF